MRIQNSEGKDMLISEQEYLVNEIDEVKSHIDKSIGIDYEEHEDLRQYITDGDLWLEDTKNV